MTGSDRIVVTAVGFDLGETLYHYGNAPLSWIELARPRLDAAVTRLGIDRAKTEAATAHERVPDYRDHLRRRLEGPTAGNLTAAALARLGGRTAARLETAVDGAFGILRRGMRAYPDAVEALAALKQAGFAVGALTNVPFGLPRRTIYRDLARTGLAPYIDAFVTSVDVGLRKPHRATFEWLAATLGVTPREMAYVGNLPTDVSGALASGCIPVFLDRTASGIDWGQAATVRDLRGLPALLTPTPA